MNTLVSCQVCIIGGGISGLTAAWRLKRAGVDVRLLESGADVGGVMRTELRNGFLLEKGPFNVIVRAPAFEALLHEFSDEAPIVAASPSARKRYIYRGGRLLAVPGNPIALAATPLLSASGKFRLASGLLWGRRAPAEEQTIHQVACRRLGREAADTLVSAVVAGIFAGDIHRLSLAACFPGVHELDQRARSPIGCMLSRMRSAKREAGGQRRRGLISLSGGLGALATAIGSRLGESLQLSQPVQSAQRHAGGYVIHTKTGDDSSRAYFCEECVLSVSAAEASRMLSPLAPQAASIIASIESAGLVVLNMGFRAADIGHPLDGYGFLVPQDEADFPLLGVLWADSVFPHHAPPGFRLLRVFMGGSRNAVAVGRPDDHLVSTATGALRSLLDLCGEPVLVDVCRYPAAIPQYYLGHQEKIGRLSAAMAELPRFHLIGNYLRGVSVNDTVALAAMTADRMLQERTEHHGARSTQLSSPSAAPTIATDGCHPPPRPRDRSHAGPPRSAAVPRGRA